MDPLSEILRLHNHKKNSNPNFNFNPRSFSTSVYNYNREHSVDSSSFAISSSNVFNNTLSVNQNQHLNSFKNTGINQFRAVGLYRGVSRGFPCLSTTANVDQGQEIGSLVQQRNGNTSAGMSQNYVIRGQWTPQEDRLLIELVMKYGTKKWTHIATKLQGRVGKQCRDRWHNHLRPDLKKETWTAREEEILIEAHMRMGNKWSEIAKRLPGRSENNVKNHWNATRRRQLLVPKRKRSFLKKQKESTPLELYISSLNSTSHAAAPHKSESNVISSKTMAVGGTQECTRSVGKEEHDDEELTMILDSLVKTPEMKYEEEDWDSFTF